jgi:predicted nucleic acid-binding protein
VRFWNSSVLVPLVVDEPMTDVLTALFHEDSDALVSFITPTEVTAAVWRKAGVNDDLRERSERRYEALEHHWLIVTDYSAALEESLRIIHRHALRAGDAIQLACAILAVPRARARLRDARRRSPRRSARRRLSGLAAHRDALIEFPCHNPR